jgi:hypothetical protein
MQSFLYRLFFTRDDDLDLLQIMFLLSIMFFFVAFSLAGLGIWEVSPDAWDIFKWVFVVLALSGTPHWIAAIIVKGIGKMSPRNSFGGYGGGYGGESETDLPPPPERERES